MTAMEDTIKTRVASLDAAVKNFEGQIKVLADLEARTKKLEKGGVAVVAATPSAHPFPTDIAGDRNRNGSGRGHRGC